MSSGGDLDGNVESTIVNFWFTCLPGDRYFVCWDPDIVPATVVQVSPANISQLLGVHFHSHMTIHQSENG